MSVRVTLQHRVVDAVFAAGWTIVKVLPERIVRTIFRTIADAAWRRRGRGVVQLERNLRRVVGPQMSEAELRELSRAGLRSYLRYWSESFRLPTWSRDRIIATFHVQDEHRLRDPLAQGRGVILALPHIANWDHAGAWCCVTGAPFTTVQERLKPESLYDRFVGYRETLGMEVLPLTGGDHNTFGLLAQRLRQGRLVCLLGDRDLTENGIEVQFFGEATRMPAGPAALTIRTGASLVPTILYYSEHGLHADLHPEVEVPAEGTNAEKIAVMTQALADAFADGIRQHPQDWHMLQRLWLSDLDPRRGRGEGLPPGTGG